MTAKANYRKTTRSLHPFDAGFERTYSAYGHATVHGAGLYVSDDREPDRPAVVRVEDVVQALQLIAVLQLFVELKEVEDNER